MESDNKMKWNERTKSLRTKKTIDYQCETQCEKKLKIKTNENNKANGMKNREYLYEKKFLYSCWMSFTPL